MDNNIFPAIFIAIVVTVTFTLALLFLFFGPFIISNLKTIKRLEGAQIVFKNRKLTKDIKKGITLQQLGQERLSEVIVLSSKICSISIENRNLGNAIQIVQFRKSVFRGITRELQTYCGLFMVGAIYTFFSILGEAKFNLAVVVEYVVRSPFKLFAFFDVAMCILFVLRLVAEIHLVKNLLEE